MLLQECSCRPKCVIPNIHARLSCMHQQEAYSQEASQFHPPSRKIRHLLQVSMRIWLGVVPRDWSAAKVEAIWHFWSISHGSLSTLLASCHAVVEAATLGLRSPQATLFCLPSDVDRQQLGTDRGQSQDWQKGLMYMGVRPVEANKDFLKPTPEMEASTDLGISGHHGTHAAIPAAPDMIVVPAVLGNPGSREHATS